MEALGWVARSAESCEFSESSVRQLSPKKPGACSYFLSEDPYLLAELVQTTAYSDDREAAVKLILWEEHAQRWRKSLLMPLWLPALKHLGWYISRRLDIAGPGVTKADTTFRSSCHL